MRVVLGKVSRVTIQIIKGSGYKTENLNFILKALGGGDVLAGLNSTFMVRLAFWEDYSG